MRKVDLKAIDAADVESLSVEERANAFYEGTAAIRRLIDDEICSIVLGQISKSDFEQAIAGTLYRIMLLLKGIEQLRDPLHFQIVNATARTVFELVLDLKLLASDQSLVPKYFAFGRVSNFHKAVQLKSFLDLNPTIDQSRHRDALSFANNAQRKAEIERDCQKHWGKKKNGHLIWPEHWSGKDIAARSNDVGIEFLEIYRSQFFIQSLYVHAGPAGIQNISREALIYTFCISHCLIQQMTAIAAQVTADEFQRFSANTELRAELKRASAASDFFAVQAVLEKQKHSVATDTQ